MKSHLPYTIAGVGLSLLAHLGLIGVASTFWESEFARKASAKFHPEPIFHVSKETKAPIPASNDISLTIPEMTVLSEEAGQPAELHEQPAVKTETETETTTATATGQAAPSEPEIGVGHQLFPALDR